MADIQLMDVRVTGDMYQKYQREQSPQEQWKDPVNDVISSNREQLLWVRCTEINMKYQRVVL